MHNRVIIWSYRWYIVLLLALVVTGEVILICLGFLVLSLFQSMSTLIPCVGLKSHNLIATWSDELQCCTASFGPGGSSLAFFAPYGERGGRNQPSPDLNSRPSSSMCRLHNPHPNNYRSSEVRTKIRPRKRDNLPRSRFFPTGPSLPNVCHGQSGRIVFERQSHLNHIFPGGRVQ